MPEKLNEKNPHSADNSVEYPDPSQSGQSVSVKTRALGAVEGLVKATGRRSAGQGDKGFHSQVIKTTPQPFCSVYPDGRLKEYNAAFLQLLGYSAQDLANKSWEEVISREWRDQNTAVISELRRSGSPRLCEAEFTRKDGVSLPGEAFVHRFFDEGDSDFHYCWFIRDSTEQKRVGAELREANERLSGHAAELEQCNRETELLTEMISLLQASVSLQEARQVIKRLAPELFSSEAGALYLRDPVTSRFDPVVLWGSTVSAERVAASECWALRLGKMYLVDSSLSGVLCGHLRQPVETASLCIPLVAQGENTGLLHLAFDKNWNSRNKEARERQKRHKQQLALAVSENIALSLANFKLRDSLYIQSIHDYLTGLYNRRYMAELLEKEVHRMARKKQPAGIIIIDIDGFKGFNDRYGHEAGDIVLREFGLFLKKNIREEDFACRYGGDEFVIILPETSLENTRQRAEQLRGGVKNVAIHLRGETLSNITLSLGVAVYPIHGTNAEMLLRTADAALYRAKTEGRDRVVCH